MHKKNRQMTWHFGAVLCFLLLLWFVGLGLSGFRPSLGMSGAGPALDACAIQDFPAPGRVGVMRCLRALCPTTDDGASGGGVGGVGHQEIAASIQTSVVTTK